MNYYGGRGRGGGRGGYGRPQRQQRERRDNDGVVFLNDKRTSDRAPVFRGQAMVAGRSYWVSVWEKQDRNGNPMLTMAFEPKDDDARRAPERPPEPRQRSFEDHQAPPRDQYDRRPMSDPYEGQRPAPRDEGDYGAVPPDPDDEVPF